MQRPSRRALLAAEVVPSVGVGPWPSSWCALLSSTHSAWSVDMALARQLQSSQSYIFRHDASALRAEKPLSQRREAQLTASSSCPERCLHSRLCRSQTNILAAGIQHPDGSLSPSMCHSASRSSRAPLSSSPHRNPLCRTARSSIVSANRLQSSVQTQAFRDAPSLLSFAVQPAVETQDVVAMGAAFLLALVWVRLWDELVNRGVIDSVSSRHSHASAYERSSPNYSS